MLLNYADAFFDKHPSKRVEIELAPGFALAQTIIGILLKPRSLECKRFDSLIRRDSYLH